MKRSCDHCNREYEAEIRYLNRGEGIYCSRKCSGIACGIRRRKVPDANAMCFYCGTAIYVRLSRQKQSKSGKFFCSKEHQNNAASKSSGLDYWSGSKGTPRTRKICKSEGCLTKTTKIYCKKHVINEKIEKWLTGDMSVSWYGENKEPAIWVKRYIVEIRGDSCEQCGWGEKAPDGRSIIQMDHIDGNYMNNTPGNLRLLCPNHHAMTPTYGRLNKNGGRAHRRKELSIEPLQSVIYEHTVS